MTPYLTFLILSSNVYDERVRRGAGVPATRRILLRLLGVSARLLGLHLGLGDLNRPEVCHGYQNACQCSHCLARENPVIVERVRQPWELAS